MRAFIFFLLLLSCGMAQALDIKQRTLKTVIPFEYNHSIQNEFNLKGSISVQVNAKTHNKKSDNLQVNCDGFVLTLEAGSRLDYCNNLLSLQLLKGDFKNGTSGKIYYPS